MRPALARRSALPLKNSRGADHFSDLDAKLNLILERLTNLERLVSVGRGPRDDADAALYAGLLALMRDGETFHAEDVIHHGELVPSFKTLLLGADIQTTGAAGYWLRRHRGHIVDGRRLDSSDRSRDGAVWSFVTM